MTMAAWPTMPQEYSQATDPQASNAEA